MDGQKMSSDAQMGMSAEKKKEWGIINQLES
jgi:hypothetical protein